MLIKDVVEKYQGKVKFVSENWGESPLAERFGITRYPVVFVDDVMVAKPIDFGWYGATGKYTPWKNKSNHEKFKMDLSRMVDLVLSGKREILVKERSNSKDATDIEQIPALSLKDLNGNSLETDKLKGQVVVVEFWATWCAPCRSTLSWLGDIKRQHGDKVTVIGMAVESEEPEIKKLVEEYKLPYNIVIGTENLIFPFGSMGSVPRMFVFDKEGKTAAVYYGASPDLHKKVGSLLDSLLK